MALTDTTVRTANPTDRKCRLFDGGDLHLEVVPAGGKWWRRKCRHLGKEKPLALGVYSDASLKEPRAKRDETRKLIGVGADPSAVVDSG